MNLIKYVVDNNETFINHFPSLGICALDDLLDSIRHDHLDRRGADVFLGFWFPLYYELKILLLIWLLSPATRGSSFLYRQVIHPTLSKKEEDMDDFVKKFKEESYSLGVK